MNKIMKLLSGLVLGVVTLTVSAADAVSISNGWVRATVPGQEVGAAYLDIKSVTEAKLVKVETSVAGSVELHSMTMDNGVMKMRMLEEMALPAGKTVNLAPGGFHFMLFDLKQPLKVGSKVTFTLSVKSSQGKLSKQSITLPVKAGGD